MKTISNIVLYTLVAAGDAGYNRHPVASASADDPNAKLVLQHAAFHAFTDARNRGVDAPKMQVLLESRKANEQGILVESSYQELDAATFQKVGEPHPERALHDPKTPKQSEEAKAAAAARAQIEARIAKSVDAMVAVALEAQQARIAEALKSGKTVAEVFESMRAKQPAEQPAAQAAAA